MRSSSALWQLAFRPFFLFGSLFSLAVMLLWILFLGGSIPRIGYLDPIIWHSHEMIFGFTIAIVAGFVLTAAQNWTGTRGVHGPRLQLLFAVWALARILLATLHSPSIVAAVLDLGFYPLLGINLWPYLKDPEMKIERVFLLFFALFFAGNLLVHLESFGIVHGYARRGVILGLDTVVVVIVFMGGRVIPFFTESSVAKAQPRTWPWVEVLSHVSAWAFLVAQFFVTESVIAALIALAAAVIHFVRLYGWQVRRVRRVPLIWVLHIAYFWIALGFLLAGLASLGAVSAPLASHAFTVGGLGVIIYGMITRVSLGHTGRRLHPDFWIVVGYYLLVLAAVARVLVPLALPSLYLPALEAAGALWIAAFAIFAVVYAPMLLSPRIDKRPG